MVEHAYTLSTWEQQQEGQEFKDIANDIWSSRQPVKNHDKAKTMDGCLPLIVTECQTNEKKLNHKQLRTNR